MKIKKYTTPMMIFKGKLFTINTGDWRYQRPVTDPEKCSKCGLCWLHCPNQTIVEKETHYETELEFCKGCGVCAYGCLSEAISMVPEERSIGGNS